MMNRPTIYFRIHHLLLTVILGLTVHVAKAQFFKPAAGVIKNILSDSRSVNIIDFNGDGWEDVFISNGRKGGQADLIYWNDGKGQLLDRIDSIPGSELLPSVGATFGDVNNDGFIDGVVSSWYGKPDQLFLNDGTGKLLPSSTIGIAESSFAEAAALGDYNGDGLLDLYITNSGGDQRNFLYRNEGGGTFKLLTDPVLVKEKKTSRGVVWTDLNQDSRLDLYVVNEGTNANDLFLSTENGTFEKVTKGPLVEDVNSTMTVSFGDIDNDGDFDCFLGNSGFYKGVPNQLFRNVNGLFEAISTSEIGKDSTCTFGSAFGDYDNDGDLDLVVTNGFCRGDLSNQLYENLGDGNFREYKEFRVIETPGCSYGVAWGDVNQDGALDLVIANCKNSSVDTEHGNTLLLNTGNDHNWLQIQLTGTTSNRSAIGAKIRVLATINGKAVWQIREIGSQSGYAGQSSLIAHFGLGDASKVEQVEIEWPSGKRQNLEQVAVNQRLTVVEE